MLPSRRHRRDGHDLPAASADAHGGIPGCWQIAVVNLATQRPGQLPYTQPSRPDAMADTVGRKLVNGEDHI
jgi:hypothetical protein